MSDTIVASDAKDVRVYFMRDREVVQNFGADPDPDPDRLWVVMRDAGNELVYLLDGEDHDLVSLSGELAEAVEDVTFERLADRAEKS